ncbi:hypothetical protein P9192_24405, partial [Klebsiella pneumoniae]|uniref:hypothetical protein n=1 Tax=Klebsiella pneumoniae TaxID=573 RepID=UPI002D1EB373
ECPCVFVFFLLFHALAGGENRAGERKSKPLLFITKIKIIKGMFVGRLSLFNRPSEKILNQFKKFVPSC